MAAGSTPATGKSSGQGEARSAARLAAVQSLYQIDLTGVSAERALNEFLLHRASESEEGSARPIFDRARYSDIVRGAEARCEEIDTMIASALAEGWALDRLDAVLRAILRAGAWELTAGIGTPPKVVINEYVNVAHAFFEDKEPGFVNGVLDRLARVMRPVEMEPPSREPAPDPG